MLQDGTIFHGSSIGKVGTTSGEICFNTGMTGYQEVFTDPSYLGQILVATTDHIGNYGIAEEDVESEGIKIAGFACKNFSYYYSRKQAKQSIQDYFADEHLVGIADLDTRALVRHIREKGAMNAVISSEYFDESKLREVLDNTPDMSGLELASRVTCNQPYEYGDKESPYRVALMDFGSKQNIIRSLAERGCYLKIFPAHTQASEVLAWKPDGIMLSNGPGDPAAMDYAIAAVKEFIASGVPMFGICLGNQILSLAAGGKTYKMHHGHRGLNHPVKNLLNGRAEITSQNHGFAIDDKSLNENVEVTHIHLNDGTVAGIRLKNAPAFAVQYHPESNPGPHDSRYLFDEFIQLMKK